MFTLCGGSSWTDPLGECYDDFDTAQTVTVTIDSFGGDAKLYSDNNGSKGAEITTFPYDVAWTAGGRKLWFESALDQHSFGRSALFWCRVLFCFFPVNLDFSTNVASLFDFFLLLAAFLRTQPYRQKTHRVLIRPANLE